MITHEEWNQLKENERYGMLANIFKRIEELEQGHKDLCKDFNDALELARKNTMRWRNEICKLSATMSS